MREIIVIGLVMAVFFSLISSYTVTAGPPQALSLQEVTPTLPFPTATATPQPTPTRPADDVIELFHFALPARLVRAPTATATPPPPPPAPLFPEQQEAFWRQESLTSNFENEEWLLFYGRPSIPEMGVLGEFEPQDLIGPLKVVANAYDLRNGNTRVRPGMHLIYAMALSSRGPNGNHLAYLEDETVENYINLTAAEQMVLILDIQIGTSSVDAELTRVLPYLRYPNVHLAIDPEFAGQPGEFIGSSSAKEINRAQALISQYLSAHSIPQRKVLIVHQFLEDMLPDKHAIDNYPRVELVINADGYGGPIPKITKYNDFVSSAAAEFAGLKLFYRWDEPLLSMDQVLGLAPYGDTRIERRPDIIIYQ
ncbi:MAG: hypothetical protein EXR62_11595 [Chloroflexi bacterium]|nr:hypothetical protein [Chloroflexota bacterium]